MGKKYLIMSDIHGNVSAFKSVLMDCCDEQYYGVILLGDCIGNGMRSNEVIQMIKNLKNHNWSGKIITNIFGNHEKLVIDKDLERLSSDRGRRIVRYTADHLSDESVEYIQCDNLDLTLMIKSIFNSKAALTEASKKSPHLKKMSPEELRELQLCLFDIYKDIKKVCDKYNLKVFLIGGSALGAVRHHGFIPWDDDMDLSMTRSDFEKFASVFEHELADKYILNSPNYSKNVRNRFPIVMKKDTYYRTLIDSKLDEHHHINVEIFILENTPDNRLYRNIKGLYCNFLSLLSWEVFIFENRNKQVKEYLESIGKANYYSRIIIGGLFSFRSSSKWFNTFDKAIRYNNDNSKCCCLATGRKRYFGEIMRREQWLPGQIAEFEGEEVLIFTDKDPYLRNLYGDYMQLPPEDKRELHTACEVRL